MFICCDISYIVFSFLIFFVYIFLLFLNIVLFVISIFVLVWIIFLIVLGLIFLLIFKRMFCLDFLISVWVVWILLIWDVIKDWFLKFGLIVIMRMRLIKFKIGCIILIGVFGLSEILVLIFVFLIVWSEWCIWGFVLGWIVRMFVFVLMKVLMNGFIGEIIRCIFKGNDVWGFMDLIIVGFIVIFGMKWLFIIFIWIKFVLVFVMVWIFLFNWVKFVERMEGVMWIIWFIMKSK